MLLIKSQLRRPVAVPIQVMILCWHATGAASGYGFRRSSFRCVDLQGIEPRPSACKAVALPLSYRPIATTKGFEPSPPTLTRWCTNRCATWPCGSRPTISMRGSHAEPWPLSSGEEPRAGLPAGDCFNSRSATGIRTPTLQSENLVTCR